MTSKAKKALQGSIRKWERILAGDGEDLGDSNCPLCKVFNKADGCEGCPVKKATGQNWCGGTPYIRWLQLTNKNFERAQNCGAAIDPAQRRQALKMLRFLETLQ